ncbi:MAG: NUDIX hydrolase [Roseivirga sp.]|nr:NUDIX hydrolase [Roseivirga sp.]
MVSDTRKRLLASLVAYESDYPAEMAFKRRFIELIENHDNCFERSLLTRHITGSVWIVDESFSAAFMTHHAKLNRWLQPGGHADGDENVSRVALKEALEETGMAGLKLYSDQIFDLDIHVIPERKGIPQHEHFDIRYLIRVDRNTPFQLSDESNELAWLPLDKAAQETDDNKSILRMVEKTKSISGKMSAHTY